MKGLSVKAAQSSLGKNVCDNILFVHAILGCDTTSRLYGVGKATGLKLITDNEHFRQLAQIFERTKSWRLERKLWSFYTGARKLMSSTQ